MAKNKKDAAEELKKTEPVEEAAEKEEVKTAEAIAEVPAEAVKEEPKEPEFIPDSKENAPKKFKAYKTIEGGYSDEQAINLLRKKIAGYKEVHERFLKKIEEADAFRLERKFIPVYCGAADVQYVWTTNVNGESAEHAEIRRVERAFSAARADLKANEFAAKDLIEVRGERGKQEMVAEKKYNFAKIKKAFNESVKNEKPEKGAKSAKRGEEYEVVYVPAVRTICMLDGEEYVGCVNLYNGECYTDYKVSEKLEKAADKAVVAARMARQSLISNAVFTAVFCALALLKVLYPNWDFGGLTLDATWVALVLLGLAVAPIVCCLGTLGYKKKAMIAKSVKTGKMPNAMLAHVLGILGWVVSAVAVVLFFFKALI